MKKILIIGIISFLMADAFSQRHVFYLHGKIVENMGANAKDTVNGYGAYKYQDILDSLSHYRFNVISEVRPKNTDVNAYAIKVTEQIRQLLSEGVEASAITVIGASKGALIAMRVSSMLKNPDVNFVLMAGCNNEDVTKYPDIHFFGNILSIYEKNDFATSCAQFKKRSTTIRNYKEIQLNTGLKHGFLYRPIPEWLNPAVKWANGNYK